MNTQSSRLKVLLVEDNPGDFRLIDEMLKEVSSAKFELVWANRLSAGLEHLKQGIFDVLLLDLGLPDSQGFDTFEKIHDQASQIPIIVLTGLADDGLADDGLAMRAVREGAQDYLVKGRIDSNLLVHSIHYATERKRAEEEIKTKNEELAAANEELVAANEEFEAANEELITTNQELQRAEEALRAASSYSRNLIEVSLDPLVTISAEGKITDVNTATEKITGMGREMLIGSDFSSYFTEPENARAGYQQVLTRGYVTDYPLSIRHQAGTITDLLYNAVLYQNEDGSTAGVFAAARDITERKRAEEALKKTMADLERSNKELEQFAYVASHDLQEPLRMVASFTQLLAKRYRDKLDADANEFINYAVDGANRMQKMVNDLLSYSRVGHRGKSFEPTDCTGILNQALTDLNVAIDENEAVITHDALPVMMGDESQLVQLFQNLIGNGIKFRSKEAPRIHISAQESGNEWIFTVQDNGIGIDPQYNERIFMIFQRLHGREEYPGTGIGLAICKKIVERHGGRVWVDSQPGNGSTFYFTIPKTGGLKL